MLVLACPKWQNKDVQSTIAIFSTISVVHSSKINTTADLIQIIRLIESLTLAQLL